MTDLHPVSAHDMTIAALNQKIREQNTAGQRLVAQLQQLNQHAQHLQRQLDFSMKTVGALVHRGGGRIVLKPENLEYLKQQWDLDIYQTEHNPPRTVIDLALGEEKVAAQEKRRAERKPPQLVPEPPPEDSPDGEPEVEQAPRRNVRETIKLGTDQ